ncbi:MAG TPA: trypsin-like peptidase domain-containing protein [Rhodopila sp.]
MDFYSLPRFTTHSAICDRSARIGKKRRRVGGLRGGIWGFVTAAAILTGTAAARELAPTSQAELIRGLLPSVVNITIRTGATAAPDQVQASASQSGASDRIAVGSGFVIDPAGMIATNWHVVTNASEITVTFSDGTRVPATVVGAWRAVDLALLKVDAGHKLQAVQWGDSSAVQIGDPVLAMGNAFGVGLSVSAGIVSALNRNIGDSLVDEFIQTDAAINHGNSGGPLFNLKGEVIGVNSAIISPTAANSGLGFAIPSGEAKFVFQRMADMPDGGHLGWLGAKIQAVTPEMAEAMGQPNMRGSIVTWVLPDQPAEKAGMIAGDVIQSLNGETFPDERALLREITQRKPGDQVTFRVWRDGTDVELKVVLQAWPKTIWEQNAAPAQGGRLTIPHDLGLAVAPLTDAVRAANEIKSNVVGVLLTGVAPGCDAALQGVVPGDVVLQVGQNRVRSPDELWRAVDQARGEGRKFGLFMLLPKLQPVDVTQFPGPKWIALRIAAE